MQTKQQPEATYIYTQRLIEKCKEDTKTEPQARKCKNNYKKHNKIYIK